MAEDPKRPDDAPEAPPTPEERLVDAIFQPAVDRYMPEAGDVDGVMQLVRHRRARLTCSKLNCRIRRRILDAGIEGLSRLHARLTALSAARRVSRTPYVLAALRFTLWMWILRATGAVVGLFRWHEEEG